MKSGLEQMIDRLVSEGVDMDGMTPQQIRMAWGESTGHERIASFNYGDVVASDNGSGRFLDVHDDGEWIGVRLMIEGQDILVPARNVTGKVA